MQRKRNFVRRLAAVLLAVVMVLPAATGVFAATDETRLVSVEMIMDTATVRVNQQRTLWVSIGVYDEERWEEVRVKDPNDETKAITVMRRKANNIRYLTSPAADWPVTWTSSNPEVAAVDGEGMVTGISPGTAVITATVDNGKSYNTMTSKVQTATCTVTVPSSALTGIELQTDNASLASSNSGERLDATRLRADAEAAAKAVPAGETATVTYADRTVVSTAALRSAAFAADYEGRAVKLRMRTLDADGAIQGQITIWPERAPAEDADILLAVNTTSQSARNAAALGRSNFRADRSAGIILSHSGAFGMSVQVAARVDLAGAANLRLYRLEGSSFTEVANAGLRLDENGYLHFNTDRGGTYVAIA